MNGLIRVGFSFLIGMFSLGSMSSWALTLESLLPSRLPEGWALIEGPRLYTKKTLFEHIDGQAEFYFKYGYQKSVFAVYQNEKKSEVQIEIDICDMGNVLQAFGIFSRLRTEGQPGGIGLDSCIEDRSILFYKGRYFVMLYGTESNPFTLKELALAVSSRIPDSSPQPIEIGFFRAKGRVPGSIQYFSEGLLGHQFLKRGFQATYVEGDKPTVEAKVEIKPKVKVDAEDRTKNEIKDKVEDESKEGIEEQLKEFTLFLAIFKKIEDAKSALRAYRDYLREKGNLVPKVPPGFGPGTLKGEDPYKGKVLIVQKGIYLVGIAGFKREKEAQARLGELIGNIR